MLLDENETFYPMLAKYAANPTNTAESEQEGDLTRN